MAVELTPRGTRGSNLEKIPRPLKKIMFGLLTFMMRLGRARLAYVITVGARSGRIYTVPLQWFPAGKDAWLVIASYGGSARHPDWYVNMAKNPDKVWIQIGNRKLKVHPESLRGDERLAAWQRIVSESPVYAGYQQKTDREIPVVRLRSVE
jgi:deazaflavin-dependent oxidoreductase (nitroreductase family)